MYSCVFWCEFIDLVGFFGCYCLTPVTLFIIRSKGSTEKQPAVRTLSHCLLEGGLQPENPLNCRFFSTKGKLLSSLHRSKPVAGNEHFLKPCPKYLLFADTVIRQLDKGRWLRGQISFDRGWLSQINWNFNVKIFSSFSRKNDHSLGL